VTAQPANGTLIGSGANLTYRPRADFSGEDTFAFVANDGQVDSEAALVTLRVGMVNDAPTAGNDFFGTGERVLSIPAPGILGNDRDIEGDNLTITIERQPAGGTLNVLSSGAFTYTPRPDFGGQDSFTYRVSDGRTSSSIAVVSLQVGAALDVTRPQIQITSPAHRSALRLFPLVSGVVVDPNGDPRTGAVTPSGIREAHVIILRIADRKFWTGSGFSSTLTRLPAQISGRTFRVTSPMPSGQNLLQGAYIVIANAVDVAGNASRSDNQVIIDTTAPVAIFDTPRNNSTVRTLRSISGRTGDTGSGVALVRVALRRADGQYFNGSGFQRNAFFTEVSRTNGRFSLNILRPGLITPGSYTAEVVVTDRAGNTSTTTSTFTLSSTSGA